MADFQSRLASLNVELPVPPSALGLYRPVLVVGNMAYLSGHGPLLPNGSAICGRLGDDMDVEAGFQAARQAALTTIASLQEALGTLDRIKRLVKTLGLVRCTPEFCDQPAVVNGFSELMREVFGEQHGIGARSAFGVPALPAGWAVEIETMFELVD